MEQIQSAEETRRNFCFIIIDALHNVTERDVHIPEISWDIWNDILMHSKHHNKVSMTWTIRYNKTKLMMDEETGEWRYVRHQPPEKGLSEKFLLKQLEDEGFYLTRYETVICVGRNFKSVEQKAVEAVRNHIRKNGKKVFNNKSKTYITLGPLVEEVVIPMDENKIIASWNIWSDDEETCLKVTMEDILKKLPKY